MAKPDNIKYIITFKYHNIQCIQHINMCNLLGIYNMYLCSLFRHNNSERYTGQILLVTLNI